MLYNCFYWFNKYILDKTTILVAFIMCLYLSVGYVDILINKAIPIVGF